MEGKNVESLHLLSDKKKSSGLGFAATVFLLAGELIGTGIVTLPFSMVTSGPTGFVLFVVITLMCCYGGVTLGRCWQIIIDRDPRYDDHIRDPYPIMGEICFGQPMRIIVRVLVYIMQFGSGVVVLLLAAQMANAMSEVQNIAYCHWILIFCASVTPLMWLGSPKDFWQAGMVALLATVLTAILIITSVLLNNNPYNFEVPKPKVTFDSIILAFSTVAFANSGIPTFPTIQNDMKDKSKFTWVVLASNSNTDKEYIIQLSDRNSFENKFINKLLNRYNLCSFNRVYTQPTRMYTKERKKTFIPTKLAEKQNKEYSVIISWLRIYIHKKNYKEIKLGSMCFDGIDPTIIRLILVHEKLENVGHNVHCIWRMLTRTGMMILVLFVGVTVPRFSYLLDVIGGSTLPLLSLVLPSIFYLRLTSDKFMQDSSSEKWKIGTFHKLFLGLLIVFGVISAVIATYVSVKQMSSHNTFVYPCYIKLL
ncbi:Amino acid transporter AVT1D [Nymphon striatum]|nr:Amino acid transporter AVT1D [Nymphon striatum]